MQENRKAKREPKTKLCYYEPLNSLNQYSVTTDYQFEKWQSKNDTDNSRERKNIQRKKWTEGI